MNEKIVFSSIIFSLFLFPVFGCHGTYFDLHRPDVDFWANVGKVTDWCEQNTIYIQNIV